MAELQFSTGIKTYSVNGVDNVFAINPTDADFVEQLYHTFEDLDKKQQAKDKEAAKTSGIDAFELARSYDLEMRRAIDGVLGDGVCGKVFGGMNVYAMAGGLPVWANFLLSLMDECDTSFACQQKKMNPRIKHYLAKYQRKR